VLINGWGNVFQEAISCVLFGMVSDRAAIFNTGGIDGYMPFKEAFRPDDMPWDAYSILLIYYKVNALASLTAVYNCTLQSSWQAQSHNVWLTKLYMGLIRSLVDLVIPRFDLPCLNVSTKADAPLITIHCKCIYCISYKL
jgi:hypothetical protein